MIAEIAEKKVFEAQNQRTCVSHSSRYVLLTFSLLPLIHAGNQLQKSQTTNLDGISHIPDFLSHSFIVFIPQTFRLSSVVVSASSSTDVWDM
jgi:hypothetical protein